MTQLLIVGHCKISDVLTAGTYVLCCLPYLLGLGVKLVLVHASVVYTVFLAAGDTDLHLQPDLGASRSHRTTSHKEAKRKGTREKKRDVVTRLVAVRRDARLSLTLTNRRLINQMSPIRCGRPTDRPNDKPSAAQRDDPHGFILTPTSPTSLSIRMEGYFPQLQPNPEHFPMRVRGG